MLVAVLAIGALPPLSAKAAIREGDLRVRMAAIQRSINTIAKRVDAATVKLEFAQARILQHQRELAKASRLLAPLRAALGKRAAELYILASGDIVETALSSPDISTFVDRRNYLELVSEGERGMVEELSAIQRRARSENKALAVALAEAERSRAQMLAARKKLDAQMHDYQSLLDLVQISGRTTTRASRTRIRGFQCPVAGPHALLNNFGDPRPGGPHTGEDISSPYGTPIVAVLGGTISQVVYGGWMGLGIILRDAAGNEWWYAHISASYVRSGEHVNAGETIGRVGCSGYCSGPHLHFEYHPGGGGPTNPHRILSRAC